jgi:quercetin 2,3-dioxygenase
MDQPEYFPVQASEVPTAELDNGKVVLNVIAGSILNVSGKITSTSVNAATLKVIKGGTVYLPLPPSHNAFIYLLDGKLNVGGFGMVEANHVVRLDNDGEGISIEGIEDTRVLLMTGEPLNEKVVSHGPFVMNSQTQILEAMRDYQMGRMGILIEE